MMMVNFKEDDAGQLNFREDDVGQLNFKEDDVAQLTFKSNDVPPLNSTDMLVGERLLRTRDQLSGSTGSKCSWILRAGSTVVFK